MRRSEGDGALGLPDGAVSIKVWSVLEVQDVVKGRGDSHLTTVRCHLCRHDFGLGC